MQPWRLLRHEPSQPPASERTGAQSFLCTNSHSQTNAAILRRAKPANPITPLPNSQAAAGNGTGAKSI